MRQSVLFGLLLALISAAGAENRVSLGPNEETTIITSGSDQCTYPFFYNHDNTFENACCWQNQGTVPGTTYGAFAEGFIVYPGGVECVALWVTQIGNFADQALDVYIWEGGITTPPGIVRSVDCGMHLHNVPMWPAIGQCDIETWGYSGDEFSAGYWADFSTVPCGWFIAADCDGFGGHPWTNIAPGIGYATGWQHPSVVWGTIQSLGIGVYVCDIWSPVESATWGRIKRLF